MTTEQEKPSVPKYDVAAALRRGEMKRGRILKIKTDTPRLLAENLVAGLRRIGGLPTDADVASFRYPGDSDAPSGEGCLWVKVYSAAYESVGEGERFAVAEAYTVAVAAEPSNQEAALLDAFHSARQSSLRMGMLFDGPLIEPPRIALSPEMYARCLADEDFATRLYRLATHRDPGAVAGVLAALGDEP